MELAYRRQIRSTQSVGCWNEGPLLKMLSTKRPLVLQLGWRHSLLHRRPVRTRAPHKIARLAKPIGPEQMASDPRFPASFNIKEKDACDVGLFPVDLGPHWRNRAASERTRKETERRRRARLDQHS